MDRQKVINRIDTTLDMHRDYASGGIPPLSVPPLRNALIALMDETVEAVLAEKA